MLMPFSCHQYGGTGIDLGVGRILHQIILGQDGYVNRKRLIETIYCKTSNFNTLFFLYCYIKTALYLDMNWG